MNNINKVTKIPSRLISAASTRKAYSGISSTDNATIEAVVKSAAINKNKDFFGSGIKQFSKINDYKEEYRKYYALEQAFEETLRKAEDPEDFVEVLFDILTQINTVILALQAFDKAFMTLYTQELIVYFKSLEEQLTKIGVLIHVDGTLGFFKGRLRRIYENDPKAFEFLVLPPVEFLQSVMSLFRSIKAIIPEKIEDHSTKDDQHGVVIDKRL